HPHSARFDRGRASQEAHQRIARESRGRETAAARGDRRRREQEESETTHFPGRASAVLERVGAAAAVGHGCFFAAAGVASARYHHGTAAFFQRIDSRAFGFAATFA